MDVGLVQTALVDTEGCGQAVGLPGKLGRAKEGRIIVGRAIEGKATDGRPMDIPMDNAHLGALATCCVLSASVDVGVGD